MTNQEINQAIAKELGYYIIQDDSCGAFKLCHPSKVVRFPWHDFEAEAWGLDAPDFCNDLNACREMEESLIPKVVSDLSKPDKWKEYRIHLEALCYAEPGWSIHANARKRAEAFLRTVGKWKE